MPTIPRLDLKSQLGPAPGPVLDRQRRPTVDNRGVIARVERLGRDAAQPLLPESLDAPYRALGALGNAIADAGGVIGALARKRQEALDRNERDKADLAFLERQAAFQDWQGSTEGQTSPHLWATRWDDTITGFQPFGEKSPISREARDAYSLDFQKASLGYRMRLADQANAQIFDTAKRGAMTKARTAYGSGDAKAGDAFLDEAVASGFMYDWQAAAEKQAGHEAATAKQDEDAFQGHLALAIGDPDGWLADESTPEGVSVVVKARLDEAARGARRNGIADAAMEIRDQIATGDISVAEQIDNLQDKRLSPSLREEMKDAVRKSNDVQHQRWVEENRQFNFVRMRKEVDAYDPASDPDGVRFQALSLAVTRDLPQDLRAEVGGQLDSKFRGLKSEPPRGVTAMVRRVADSLFDEGKFGQWKGRVDAEAAGLLGDTRWMKQVGISSADRAAIDGATTQARKVELFRQAWKSVDASTEDKRKAMADFEIGDREKVERLLDGATDETAKRQAMAVQARMERQMDEWLKANPGATEEQALEKFQEFAPAGVRAGVLFEMQRARSGSASSPRAANPRGFREAPDLRQKLPGPLQAHAQDFIDAGRETGLDPKFLAAIAMFETGDGTSSAFRNKKNAMGISDANGPVSQASVRESIFRQARTLARSEGPYSGADTIEAIGAIYAPPGAGNDPKATNHLWPRGVREKYSRL